MPSLVTLQLILKLALVQGVGGPSIIFFDNPNIFVTQEPTKFFWNPMTAPSWVLLKPA